MAAVIGIAAVALIAVVLAGPAEAAFPGANGRIAFTHGHITITSMGPDGSQHRNLTGAEDIAADPAWSPDGTRIAFAHATWSSWPNRDIFVMDADGSHKTSVTSFGGDEAHPSWSPDGSKLVFERTVDESPCGVFPSCGVELFTVNVDGTGARRLTDNRTFDLRPSWSPDGKRIAFQRMAKCDPFVDCDWDLYTITPEGTEETNLLQNGEANRDPDWSPDGREIAFSSTLGACCMGEIYKMNADGSAVTPVTSLGGHSSAWSTSTEPAWSPDGAKIAFSAGYSGLNHSEIHVVDVASRAVRRLTNSLSVKFGPDWQPLNRAPDCSGVIASADALLPANRKLVRVILGGATDPDGDPVAITVDGVTQDEPVTATGDPTAPDAARGAPGGVELRAERNPHRDGRVYHVAFRGEDGSGGSCTGSVTVAVPRHAAATAVDSAPPSYDSFGD